MNTKQKLTLGIAAIFMVTLTIVGVTYAYFVTQVTGNNGEDVITVTAATIPSVEYGDGNGVISMTNVMPGTPEDPTVRYKTFSVTNKGDEGNAALTYNIFYKATPKVATAGYGQFIHSSAATNCYNVSDNKIASLQKGETTYATDFTDCFNGSLYDNLYVTLYKTDTANQTTDLSADDIVVGETKLSYLTAEGTKVLLNSTQTQPVEVGAPHYYTLKVEYKSYAGNQNLEAEAGVTVLVDIN